MPISLRGLLARTFVLAGLFSPGNPLLHASENVPHAPFAQWAEVPEKGSLVVGLFYEESDAYSIWAGDTRHNVTWFKGGEEYGIDINQGYVTFQYGVNERWAADLAIGYTTAGWRYFSNNGNQNGAPMSTTGIMDAAIGFRYQIWNEHAVDAGWKPTVTFRAGAVLPGGYNKDFPFAPGDRSAAIEPEVLLRKHFGWPGFGIYTDGLFRWNRTSHNDHWILSAGLVQEIKSWELNVGYRRLGSVGGSDIVLNADRTIIYPRAPREENQSVEAGFTYTTKWHRLQVGFYSRAVLDGTDSDSKFWVGGYVNMPFQILGGSKGN